jgi:hypothetical protein
MPIVTWQAPGDRRGVKQQQRSGHGSTNDADSDMETARTAAAI